MCDLLRFLSFFGIVFSTFESKRGKILFNCCAKKGIETLLKDERDNLTMNQM
jgi:hypothetical protein